MEIKLIWSKKLWQNERRLPFCRFAQMMINRLLQGSIRYGAVQRDHCYWTRMQMEVKAYKRSGNVEHLFNIANYCLLESMSPENPKFHFDNTVESVTRGKF
jgi:hypothetical protein